MVNKYGSRHVHCHAFDDALVVDLEVQSLDARCRQQSDVALVGHAALIHILADAAAGVAAHEPFGPIGIEDAHREVGIGG